jgi:riboflavin kinase / FMN adenylyltransferase
MDIVKTLDIEIQRPLALTIGNFDGVHIGHQSILERTVQEASSRKGLAAVLTFENHPIEVLRPSVVVPRLCSLQHRLRLMEAHRVDLVILLRFTKEFAEQTAEEFLCKLCSHCRLAYLILGEDAVLGRDRLGDQAKVQELAKSLHFDLDYLNPQSIDGMVVSSSLIRNCIVSGKLDLVEKLLSRKYSIYQSIIKGQGLGKTLGFPTLNVEVNGLCLPPQGVYAVKLSYGDQLFDGIANLGQAPTIRTDQKILLEVNLFNFHSTIPTGAFVEVFFYGFIREEKQFESTVKLQEQISNDIEKAKYLLGSAQNSGSY